MKPPSEVMDFVATQVKPTGVTTEWLEAAKEKLRALARKDFFWFLRWPCQFEDIDNTYHREYIHRWQIRRHFPYTITLAARKHLKTTISVVGDTLYEAIQLPVPDRPTYQGANTRRLIFTAALDLGVDMLVEMRGITETSQLFRFLFPEYCMDLAPKHLRDRCRDRQDEFDWPCRTLWKKEPSVSVAAEDASRTSQHFDYKSHDDIQNETNVDNREIRDKGHSRFLNSWQLRHDIVYSRTRLTATRWHYDDIAGREMAKEMSRRENQRLAGEKVKPQCLIYVRRIMENGEPVWPERFPKQACLELRQQLGAYIYSCQMENNPVSPENAIFKREDVRWAYESDLVGKPIVSFAALDLAVEEKQSSDFTAIAVCSVDDHGRLFYRYLFNERTTDMDKILRICHELTRKFQLRLFGAEGIAFQRSLSKEYRRRAIDLGLHIPWVEIPRQLRMSKLSRWLNLQPVVQRGDLHIMRGLENAEVAMDQLTSLTPDHYPTYDDLLDVMTDAYMLSSNAPGLVAEQMPQDCIEAMATKALGPLFGEGPRRQVARIGSNRSKWYP